MYDTIHINDLITRKNLPLTNDDLIRMPELTHPDQLIDWHRQLLERGDHDSDKAAALVNRIVSSWRWALNKELPTSALEDVADAANQAFHRVIESFWAAQGRCHDDVIQLRLRANGWINHMNLLA